MFIAAVVHHFAFSFKPYSTVQPTSLWRSVKDAIGVGDIATDTVELLVPRDAHVHLPAAVRKKLTAPRYGANRDSKLSDNAAGHGYEEHEALLAHEDEDTRDRAHCELNVISTKDSEGETVITFTVDADDTEVFDQDISPEKTEQRRKSR